MAPIAKQPFGGTGHLSTRTVFGAAALSRATPEQAAPVLDLLLEHGVNHIDTAASYGRSEELIGPWMERHRDRFFLATKTDQRTHEGALSQLHRSLELLRVPNVDLWQLHNLVDPAEWGTAMGPGGALEAAIEAREQGLTRFIGVTGHGVTVAGMHLRSLERFPFDSVLPPYNFLMMQNPDYARDFEALAKLCAERGVALQTIKSIQMRPWGDRPQTANTWYEPLQEQADIDVAVSWVLGRAGVFLNTVGDMTLLPMVLDAAERAGPRPTDAEMTALVARRSMASMFV